MNIFILNRDPVKAAKLMCDQHIRSKMIIESAQMLAYCFSPDQLADSECPRTATGGIRKQAKRHKNHPCSKWVVQSRENMRWLIRHAIAMCEERSCRWAVKEHFTRQFIEWCADNIDNSSVPEAPLTDWAIAINENMNCRKVPFFESLTSIEKYNLYYKLDKPFATWTPHMV